MSAGLTQTVIAMDLVPFRFGPDATSELPFELERLRARRVLLVADRALRPHGLVDRVERLVRDAGAEVVTFDQVHIEPTDRWLRDAIAFAREVQPDAYVSLGGGSTIDTAKAMNLFTTHPADLFDYINKPVGKGLPVPGPLAPHIALPTTAGTGSETTAVIALELSAQRLKTGISHRYLRPTIALVDPLNTVTCPPMVTAYAGLDVLCHAIESYTAKPYHVRPQPPSPAERPAYIGSNPIADLWSAQAIRWGARYLRRAFFAPLDLEARSFMALASLTAGIGFGNAGVHIPHAMSYPIAGMVREYFPPDYEVDEPLIPHGLAVVVGAPAALRFTAAAWPERHAEVAELLGIDTRGMPVRAAAEAVAEWLQQLMRDLGLPSGLEELGFTEQDIPALVQGTLAQQRILVNSPRPVDERSLAEIFRQALRYW
ncbi:MAG: iron-containing alcohol dehydrogenase [Thermomicrobium sp.]|nr:iron-containing alcohol dehydrogenase [Thermomicrobium sp.]